ncbi:hypothetical protein GOODEAATRI_004534 [Goodea atripinnis]|uniref:AP180 N-terminal homology (ANTH) domain-containing protein n=1 Tax=Goodea atripinnis TaxID=208336 RepID=A0ABV0PBE9_9TELE
MAVTSLTSGQCRLAPLIQVVQDCSQLYHFSVKLLFKLHACLPADTLQGHRDRFREQFNSRWTYLIRHLDLLMEASMRGDVNTFAWLLICTYNSYSKLCFSFLDLKAQRYVTQLKSQINSLEAELEDQRVHKQHALVENEQLRMELAATRHRNAEHESLQSTFIEAESKMFL